MPSGYSVRISEALLSENDPSATVAICAESAPDAESIKRSTVCGSESKLRWEPKPIERSRSGEIQKPRGSESEIII